MIFVIWCMGYERRDRIVRRGKGKDQKGKNKNEEFVFCILYFGIWFLENEIEKGNGKREG